MKSNFESLKDNFPVLANFGELAEKYLYSDSNFCSIKLGMVGETIVNLIFTYDRIPLPYDNTAVKRIDTLFREGMIPRDLVNILHALRKIRNKAVHESRAASAAVVAKDERKNRLAGRQDGESGPRQKHGI